MMNGFLFRVSKHSGFNNSIKLAITKQGPIGALLYLGFDI